MLWMLWILGMVGWRCPDSETRGKYISGPPPPFPPKTLDCSSRPTPHLNIANMIASGDIARSRLHIVWVGLINQFLEAFEVKGQRKSRRLQISPVRLIVVAPAARGIEIARGGESRAVAQFGKAGPTPRGDLPHSLGEPLGSVPSLSNQGAYRLPSLAVGQAHPLNAVASSADFEKQSLEPTGQTRLQPARL